VSCNSTTVKTDDSATTSPGKKDSITSPNPINNETSDIQFSQHHLQDTTVIRGDFVLFLRPDSIRFENYSKEDENIYDADSDFGFGISATTDSISRNKKYNNIHTTISDKRYVVIMDCKNCPKTIDRDTINYGLILASKGKEIKIQTNLHSGDYLQDVDEYFNMSNRKIVDRKY
jgi:hypothetical protein